MVNGTTKSVKIIVCFDNEISSELKKAAGHKNGQFFHCHLAILSNTKSDLCYYGLDELKCNFYIFLAGKNRIQKMNC